MQSNNKFGHNLPDIHNDLSSKRRFSSKRISSYLEEKIPTEQEKKKKKEKYIKNVEPGPVSKH